MRRSPIKRKLGRLKRGARIRPVSKKRAALNRVAAPFRQNLKEEIGHCEICHKTPLSLDAHEIARGGIRAKALDKRYAILVLCRDCHQAVTDYPALWCVARQAAVLKRSRPADYDLEKLNGLLLRRITAVEVSKQTPHLRPGRE